MIAGDYYLYDLVDIRVIISPGKTVRARQSIVVAIFAGAVFFPKLSRL